MDNNLLQIKIKQRINKLASSDYDNIQCWQISEAFNNATLKWIRQQLIGYNLYKSGDEGSKNLIDDLQVLISNVNLTFNTLPDYVETIVIPSNFLYFKRLEVYAKTDNCSTPRRMIAYQAQQADVAVLLEDDLSGPSFEWGETFFVIGGNRLRIYTKGKFTVTGVTLIYYRRPLDIKIKDCVNPSTGVVETVNVNSEFKDDIAEILADYAATILAGDIEQVNQYQINSEKVKSVT